MSSRSAPAGPGPGAEAPGRCAHCGARLNPADQWCTLCHTPVFALDDDRFDEPGAGQDHVPEQHVHEPMLAEPMLADPLRPEPMLAEQRAEPDREPRTEHLSVPAGRTQLSPERIEQLLERLAAEETRAESPTGITLLDGLGGRGKGQALLLAGVGGLVLLAGGLLALYVLGTLL